MASGGTGASGTGGIRLNGASRADGVIGGVVAGTDSEARIIDILCEGEIEGLATDDPNTDITISGGPPAIPLPGNFAAAEGGRPRYVQTGIHFAQDAWRGSYGIFNYRRSEPRIGIDFKTGADGQTAPRGIESIERDGGAVDQGVITRARPVSKQVQGSGADSFRVTLHWPALYKQKSNGNITSRHVNFRVEMAEHGTGAWTTVLDQGINQEWQSPRDVSFEFDRSALARSLSIEEGDPRIDRPDIRVSRLTEDTTGRRVSAFTWKTLTEITELRQSYPYTAYCAWAYPASLQQSLAGREYALLGWKVQVPSDYTTPARHDTPGVHAAGAWDGLFKDERAFTTNPAWCLYALLGSRRAGLANDMPDEALREVRWDFHKVARWMDEDVGGRARHSLTWFLNEQVSASTFLRRFEQVFQCRLVEVAGRLRLFALTDDEAVAMVTNANAKDGKFEQGSAVQERYSVVHVRFNDPAANYRLESEIVIDDALVKRHGHRTKSLTAYGTTSRAQAHRMGRHFLYTQEHESETLVYVAGNDHASVRPGDIIMQSDEARARARLFGRVSGNVGTVVESGSLLSGSGDRLVSESGDALVWPGLPVVPAAIKQQSRGAGTVLFRVDLLRADIAATPSDWSCLHLRPDGAMERRIVAAAEGNWVLLGPSDVNIRTDKPVDDPPPIDSPVIFESDEVSPRAWRVGRIERTKGGMEHKITCTAHLPGRLGWVEDGTAVSEPSYRLPPDELPAPASITLALVPVSVSDGDVHRVLRVTVEPSGAVDGTSLEYEHSAPDSDGWESFAASLETVAEIDRPEIGQWIVRVRNRLGSRASAWNISTVLTVEAAAPLSQSVYIETGGGKPSRPASTDEQRNDDDHVPLGWANNNNNNNNNNATWVSSRLGYEGLPWSDWSEPIPLLINIQRPGSWGLRWRGYTWGNRPAPYLGNVEFYDIAAWVDGSGDIHYMFGSLVFIDTTMAELAAESTNGFIWRGEGTADPSTLSSPQENSVYVQRDSPGTMPVLTVWYYTAAAWRQVEIEDGPSVVNLVNLGTVATEMFYYPYTGSPVYLHRFEDEAGISELRLGDRIIGARLRENPRENVTLTVTSDNPDVLPRTHGVPVPPSGVAHVFTPENYDQFIQISFVIAQDADSLPEYANITLRALGAARAADPLRIDSTDHMIRAAVQVIDDESPAPPVAVPAAPVMIEAGYTRFDTSRRGTTGQIYRYIYARCSHPAGATGYRWRIAEHPSGAAVLYSPTQPDDRSFIKLRVPFGPGSARYVAQYRVSVWAVGTGGESPETHIII